MIYSSDNLFQFGISREQRTMTIKYRKLLITVGEISLRVAWTKLMPVCLFCSYYKTLTKHKTLLTPIFYFKFKRYCIKLVIYLCFNGLAILCHYFLLSFRQQSAPVLIYESFQIWTSS